MICGSGRDRHRKKLGHTELLRHVFPISPKSSDMHLDCFGSALPALIDARATGEAAPKSWGRHGVPTARLWFQHDCVSAHRPILSRGCSKLLGCHPRLRKDGPEQLWANDLACVQRHGDTTTTCRMLELSVRSLLFDDNRAELPGER